MTYLDRPIAATVFTLFTHAWRAHSVLNCCTCSLLGNRQKLFLTSRLRKEDATLCRTNSARLLNSPIRSNPELRVIFLVAMFCALVLPTSASTPSSGTLSPAKGSSATWAGNGIAGATTDETTCV